MSRHFSSVPSVVCLCCWRAAREAGTPAPLYSQRLEQEQGEPPTCVSPGKEHTDGRPFPSSGPLGMRLSWQGWEGLQRLGGRGFQKAKENALDSGGEAGLRDRWLLQGGGLSLQVGLLDPPDCDGPSAWVSQSRARPPPPHSQAPPLPGALRPPRQGPHCPHTRSVPGLTLGP